VKLLAGTRTNISPTSQVLDSRKPIMKLYHLITEIEQNSHVLFSSNTPPILEVAIKIVAEYSVILINLSKKIYSRRHTSTKIWLNTTKPYIAIFLRRFLDFC